MRAPMHLEKPLGTRSSSLTPPLRFPALCVLVLLWFPSAAPGPVAAESGHSAWWPELEVIDQDLRQQRFGPAAKASQKLGQRIVKKAWHDPELRAVLGELALYRALAAHGLGQLEEAIWYWQVAQGLDSRLKQRDLSEYHDAADFFARHPLRELGRAPADLAVERQRKTRDFQPARQVAMPQPRLDLAAVGEGRRDTGPFEAEFVVDERGHVLRPVITSPLLHPVILYATLEAFRGKVVFEPARLDGQPVAVLMPVKMNFKSSRW